MSYGRGQKISLEECQRRVSLVSPNIEVLEYNGNKNPSPCRCKLCGNEWYEPAKNLFRGSNCPKCFKRKTTNRTPQSFREEIAVINPDIDVIGDYRRIHEKILCRCKTCGREWQAEPAGLLFGRGCEVCRRKAAIQRRTKTNDEFVAELTVKNPTVIPLEQYQGANTSILVQCSKCDHIWKAEPTNLFFGTGCPQCWKERKKYVRRKSHVQFVEDVRARNPDIEVVSQYDGAKGIVILRCRNCGTEWECSGTSATSHAIGCPNCVASHGEKAIAAHLDAMHVTYLPQKRFDGLVGVGGAKLSYDFYLPEYKTLIEYQGQFHDGTTKLQTEEQLIKQKEHDARKRAYAQSHGYHLIEIWYWDFTRIQEILNTELNLSSVVA